MRLLLLINWILSSCWDVHTFVLPILGHERGLSASVIGAILGTFAIAATVVRVVVPMIALSPAGVGGDHRGDAVRGGSLRRVSIIALAVGDVPVFGPVDIARFGTADDHEHPAFP